MVSVHYSWQDDGVAGVREITCNCGYVDKYADTVHGGSTWTCSKCGRKIKFVWKGMEEVEVNGPTKVTPN